jgi:hypothetical protein
MQLRVPRRQPTLAERVLGRQRARRLRRRVAFLALGTGVVLLRPRRRTTHATALMLIAVLLTSALLVAAR